MPKPRKVIERRASSGFAPCPEPQCPGILTVLVTETMVVLRCSVSGRLVEATRIVDEPHPWWSR